MDKTARFLNVINTQDSRMEFEKFLSTFSDVGDLECFKDLNNIFQTDQPEKEQINKFYNKHWESNKSKECLKLNTENSKIVDTNDVGRRDKKK